MEKTKKIKLAVKISVQASLLSIPMGETVEIKANQVKANSVRSAVRQLRKEGYGFHATEKGLIDSILVTTTAPNEQRFGIKSCREITFEFIRDGYEIIQKYSTHAYSHSSDRRPFTHCFDDLGSESALKYFGNQCNVMGEILLSRYDHFIAHKMITHATTNLSASELEDCYGNRVRSRMRDLFNMVAFDREAKDKRK